MLNKFVNLILLALMLSFTQELLAMDYSVFTNKELLELKGAVGHASQEEQAAYTEEWEKRLQKMNNEEREQYEKSLQTSEVDKNSPEGKEKAPIVQGKGYEKGEGIIIFGGPATGNSPGRGGRN